MSEDYTYPPGDLKWLLLVVVVVAIVAAVGSRIVLPGTVAISERNGQFFRILKPGYHLIIPGVDNHSVAAEVAAQLTPVAQTWGIEVQRVEITP